jgi:hypothetical protein
MTCACGKCKYISKPGFIIAPPSQTGYQIAASSSPPVLVFGMHFIYLVKKKTELGNQFFWEAFLFGEFVSCCLLLFASRERCASLWKRKIKGSARTLTIFLHQIGKLNIFGRFESLLSVFVLIIGTFTEYRNVNI